MVGLEPSGKLQLPPRLVCDNTVSMKRRTLITKKRRGPAPTGKGTLIGVRIQPDDLAVLDSWITGDGRGLTRPQAIRRLIEQAKGK